MKNICPSWALCEHLTFNLSVQKTHCPTFHCYSVSYTLKTVSTYNLNTVVYHNLQPNMWTNLLFTYFSHFYLILILESLGFSNNLAPSRSSNWYSLDLMHLLTHLNLMSIP